MAELRPVSAESQRLAQERRLEPLKKNQSQHSRKRGEHQYGGRPKTCPLSPLYLRADLFPRRQPQRAVSVGRRKIFQKSSTPHQKVYGPSDLKPLLSRTASSLLLLSPAPFLWVYPFFRQGNLPSVISWSFLEAPWSRDRPPSTSAGSPFFSIPDRRTSPIDVAVEHPEAHSLQRGRCDQGVFHGSGSLHQRPY